MKNILNIVITGGPCGGKTTALSTLTELLRSYGYTVYLVNETATELINDGMKPFGDNKLDLISFQSLILDAQIAKEDIRRKAANMCSNSNVAILYDRGILDNRAYINDEVFQKLLKERNITEAEILARYDLIIHLVTAAIGKEEYYTTINNTARTETVEEAGIQDKKTLDTWKNHPNLRIATNDTLFDEKILKVKNYINSYIGEQNIIKQQRYYIEIGDIDFNKCNYPMVKEDIEEFVLNYDNEYAEIYIKSTINNSSYYTCSTNQFMTNSSILKIISEENYNEALSKLKGQPMNKIRYNFIVNNERFRLDIFKLNDMFAILERDVVDIKQMNLPNFIKNAIDITDNRDYNDDSIYIDYNIQKIYKKNN